VEKITYTLYQPSEEANERIKDRSVLLIDNDASQKLLTMDECLAALEEAFQEEGLGAAVNRTKAAIHMPSTEPGGWMQYVSMEGGIRKLGVVALRIRSHMHTERTMYDHSRHDFYSVVPGKWGGIILLFSAADGTLLAFLNDGHIQHMRVSATSALSAKYMARENARTLGILGSGGMAMTHAWSMSRVKRLRQIKVYSPNPEHRALLVEQLNKDIDVEVIGLDDPRAVVQGSDIVSACTNSNEPVIKGSWLEPGMHVTLVTQNEIDDDGLRRVDRYVQYRSAPAQHHFTTPEDWRPPSLGGSSLEIAEKEERLVGKEKMATLPQVLLGQTVGRLNDQEITYFTSEGTGIQFAALGLKIYQKAKEKGLGRKLPLSWFLQDIKS
jgi:ornithine cyclodeaminase/alanine dehydrogenase-like protein (mu-crystallin family)